MTISKLNHLFNDSQDYILASNLSGSCDFNHSQFLSDFYKLRDFLKESSQQRWLLSYQQPYLFVAGFLALLSLNKTVVLSANRKTSWLAEIGQSFDAILGDNLTSIQSNKRNEEIGFSQLNSFISSPPGAIQFSGSESIIFFTSGSTGKAKEVTKKLSYLVDEVATLETTFGAQLANAATVSSVSHFHIYGLLFNLLWPLLSRRMWLIEEVEFQEQLHGIDRNDRELVFVSSPAFLSRLDQSMKFDQAKMVFSSGGPLSFESASVANNVFGSFPIEVYGSTETGGIGYRTQKQKNQTWNQFDKVALTTESDGIYVASPHIGNNLRKKLDDNIQILSQSSFMLAGRNDRIVKIEEKRISLTEIEDYLNALPIIKDSACVVFQGSRTIIGAVLVLSQLGAAELKEKGRYWFFQSLKQTMRTRFENVTIPRKWRILEKLPVNQQSKREYSELKSLFETAS